jgi:hypothetical protein
VRGVMHSCRAGAQQLFASRYQKLFHFSDPFAHASGDCQDRHCWPDVVDVVNQYCPLEAGCMCLVQLGYDGNIGSVENCRILQWLVLAFGCGNQNKSQILAEVKAGRAHEVANVFDKQEVEGLA